MVVVFVPAVYATEANKLKWKAPKSNNEISPENNSRPLILKQIFERAASSSGSLFGSVNAADVKEKLISAGIQVDGIAFEPLKTLGLHTVQVNGEPVEIEIVEPRKQN